MTTSQSYKVPPFKVDINIYPPLENMRLKVVAKGKQPNQDLELLRDVLSYFVSAANAGMFSSLPYKPEQALMKIESIDENSKGELNCIWESRNINIGAYRILLKMVTQSHHGHAPLSYFGMSSTGNVGGLTKLENVLDSPYPERASNLPFSIDLAGDLDSVTMPAIRLVFSRDLNTKEFQNIEELIADWHTIILLGGYSDSFEAIKELPMHPGKTYMASPCTIEHVLYDFNCPSEVYDALINMAVKLHTALSPLLRIEIE